MKQLGALFLVLATACGGSSSSTPPPQAPAQPPSSGEVVTTNAFTGATVATVLAYDAMGAAPRSRQVTDATTVAAMIAAAAPTEVPGQGLRKCPDTYAVEFSDATRGSFGSVGFCNGDALTAETPLEGPQLNRGSSTVAVTLADEPALRALVVANLPE